MAAFNEVRSSLASSVLSLFVTQRRSTQRRGQVDEPMAARGLVDLEGLSAMNVLADSLVSRVAQAEAPLLALPAPSSTGVPGASKV